MSTENNLKPTSLSPVYIKLVFAAFFWGGTFIAGRILAQRMGPFSAAFMRFGIAAVFLVLLTWKMEKRIPLPARHQLFPIFLLGMTGIFLYNFFFFSGLKSIEAGRASIIIANNPILIALLSAFFFGEKLTAKKILGILVSVTGAVIVISRGRFSEVFQGRIGHGELFLMGAVVCWVLYSVIGKALMKDFSPVLSVTYSVVAGTIFLLAPAWDEGMFQQMAFFSGIEWMSLFYLGFFGTVVAFMFYYQGIHRIGPTKAGLFINFVPVSAVFLSFLILDESVNFSLLAGLCFVTAGIYLTTRPDQGS